MSAKIKSSFSIDKELYDAIKAVADKEERSYSQQVVKVLKEFLKEYNSQKDQEDK